MGNLPFIIYIYVYMKKLQLPGFW